MSSSNLIRWGGMAAMVAGVLFIAVDLVVLSVLGFGQSFGESLVPSGLLFQSAAAPLAGALLLLGLVGLYARQSEATRQSGATDVIGLVGFLFALFGTVLALAGNVWANLLAYFGWALFGVSSLQARVYPPAAAILLTTGALIAAPFSIPVAGTSSVLVYMGTGASIIFNGAVAWLGLVLFLGRSVAAEPIPKEE